MPTPAIPGEGVLSIPTGVNILPEGSRHDNPTTDAKCASELFDRMSHELLLNFDASEALRLSS